MNKKRILINAAMSTVQVLVIGINLFVLYRFLLRTIGVQNLGIWSVVLAITSVSQIANFGLSGSVVKFVSKYLARNQEEKVSTVIQTAVLSLMASVGILLLIGYPITKAALRLVIEKESLPAAISILPFAFVAFWLLLTTGIVQAGLDGSQRIDIRSWILIGDSFSFLILCYLLAKRYGLLGLAVARVIENAVVLIITWIILRTKILSLPYIPHKWDKGAFKEIIGYGVNFQIISIGSMLHDPITKAFLSRFGGLAMTGYYEMASKMIWQVRSLIASATYAIAPAVAHLQEKDPDKIKKVYTTSLQLLIYLAIPLFSLIMVSTPAISLGWIGYYQKEFIFSALVLSVGWFFNIASVPAYFSSIGIGDLRLNVRSVLVAGLLNILFGASLGHALGGRGVVLGWALSLILSSAVLLVGYNRREGVRTKDLAITSYGQLVILSVAGLSLMYLVRSLYPFRTQFYAWESLMIGVFIIIISFPVWRHRMRRKLYDWVMHEILGR